MPEETASISKPSKPSELVAENLCFSYLPQEDILTGINLSFHKGEVTGIVGKSGSGKSTLLKLLMGLYSPTEGNDKLKCGTETFSGEDIVSQVAYVPPEDYLFSGTIAENIVMSDNICDNDKLGTAAASANISDYRQHRTKGLQIGEK